jgi:predicted RNA-binding Zn ribbon-like protein
LTCLTSKAYYDGYMVSGVKKDRFRNQMFNQSSFLELGGHPVLDFCNTIVFHGDFCEDSLPTEDMASRCLSQLFKVKLKITSKQFKTLIQLRTALIDYFKDCIDLNTPIKKHKPGLDKILSEVPLVMSPDKLTGQFTTLKVAQAEKKYLEPVVVSFLEFSNQFKKDRLKKCLNPNCSHLFYDTSKNKTRNWCSMQSCGNIMKARSFHKRKMLAKGIE